MTFLLTNLKMLLRQCWIIVSYLVDIGVKTCNRWVKKDVILGCMGIGARQPGEVVRVIGRGSSRLSRPYGRFDFDRRNREMKSKIGF